MIDNLASLYIQSTVLHLKCRHSRKKWTVKLPADSLIITDQVLCRITIKRWSNPTQCQQCANFNDNNLIPYRNITNCNNLMLSKSIFSPLKSANWKLLHEKCRKAIINIINVIIIKTSKWYYVLGCAFTITVRTHIHTT